MNPSTYIKQRQILWALRNHKPLGSQFRNHLDPAQQSRGEKSFVYELDDNLFEALGDEARQDFESGDGDELGDKMFAVNSSSATAVNVFHYWRSRRLWGPIARALDVPSTRIPGARQLVRPYLAQATLRIGSGNTRSGSARSRRQPLSSPLRCAASSAAKASTP